MNIVVRDPVMIAMLASFAAPVAAADPPSPHGVRHIAVAETWEGNRPVRLNLGAGTRADGAAYGTAGISTESARGWSGWIDRRSDGPMAVGVAFRRQF